MEDAEGFRREVGRAFERMEYVTARLCHAVASTLGLPAEAFDVSPRRPRSPPPLFLPWLFSPSPLSSLPGLSSLSSLPALERRAAGG